MSLRKRLAVTGLIVVFLIALVAGGSGYYYSTQTNSQPVSNSNGIAATYKGGSVTEAEYRKQFDFQRKLIVPTFEETADTRTAFLQEYITMHKILVPMAKQAGIKVNESGIADQVQQYKQQVTDLAYDGDQQKFAAAMSEYGITDDDIKQAVIDDEYLRQYKDKKVGSLTVTAAEVKSYFDSHKDVFDRGTVSQIIVKTQAEANQVRDRLTKGEDFAKVAKEVSIDPTVQQNGGTLTDVAFDMFDPQMQAEAAKLTLGALSDPFQTTYGWSILRVDQRTTPTFAEAQKDAHDKALEDKQNAAWDQFYTQVQQGSAISVNAGS